MGVSYHKKFKKQYKKLTRKEQKAFDRKLFLFVSDQFHPFLNNHALKGKFINFRSVNIDGDLRAIYKISKDGNVIFMLIGTHSELY